MRYPKERKEAVLRKMMPPHNRSVPELAEEEGISEATLYIWRRQAREKELQRKEKALAEAAALIVLRKKAQAIWWDDEAE